jgi:hypothetical protein
MQKHDPALDTLLELNGITLVVDPQGGHWVRFVVNKVPPTPEKPHGLDYSLTLHDRTVTGWSDSITPIRLPTNGAGSRRTIATVSER